MWVSVCLTGSRSRAGHEGKVEGERGRRKGGKEGGREGGRGGGVPALLLADAVHEDLEGVVGADDEGVQVALFVGLDGGHT